MKIFHCDHCEQLVFFENIRCVNCKHPLAYLPDISDMGSLEELGKELWRSPARGAEGRTYRLCKNYSVENVCNWAVPNDDPNPLCESCRLTRVIPNLTQAGHREAWYLLESAKRRLVYSLFRLGLPLKAKAEDPKNGVAFEFLADPQVPGAPPVLTGHNEGVITLNIAEANDAEREKRRLELFEPYRTLLGHFRHEIGHHFWDRLIKDSKHLEGFRKLFGEERADYDMALKRHYKEGASPTWQQNFVSSYASAHPWEDWAETWAHYLHITDTLETATACGLSLRPKRSDEPALTLDPSPRGSRAAFESTLARWFPLTYVLNNLNRDLGRPDAYPFVLSTPATEKLRFVHDAIGES